MWYANATPCANGSKLFEPYDYEVYSKVQSQFAGLSSGEKAQYRGAEHYATLKTGIELTPLNTNFRKMMEEISERLKSPSTTEALQIDTVFQSDLILNLLISLENEDHINEAKETIADLKNTIVDLTAQLTSVRAELANYKSVRGVIRIGQLEQENSNLRNELSWYEEIINRNSLRTYFSHHREKTYMRDKLNN